MGILDLVFPKTCLNCGKEGSYICQSCLFKVKRRETVCPYCRKASIYGMTHPKCFQENGLDGLISVFSYKGVIGKAILSLRYRYATEITKELSAHLTRELRKNREIFKKDAVLVPIPLHWQTGNTRGFNQAEIIGKEVAKQLRLKFIPDLLIRTKSTVSKTSLNRKLPSENIEEAFEISPNFRKIDYPNLVLFDDVFTTESTIKEAAKILKTNGVKRVWGLTIAR